MSNPCVRKRWDESWGRPHNWPPMNGLILCLPQTSEIKRAAGATNDMQSSLVLSSAHRNVTAVEVHTEIETKAKPTTFMPQQDSPNKFARRTLAISPKFAN
jgi:hypothetical protein